MRKRVPALLLPVLLVLGLVAVPAPASAAATSFTCVEYLPGALICSPPAAAGTGLPYDRLDATAQAATPGSYAFLDPTGHVVTTYEALRDGTATGLRIHTSDATGASHAAIYAAFAAGDVVEWRVADDCWVRYEVTSVLPNPPATAPRKHFAVKWRAYAFTGCAGEVAVETAAIVTLSPEPNFLSPRLTTPVRHGPYQIIPHDWTGATEEAVRVRQPTSEASRTSQDSTGPTWPSEDPAVVRQHPLWNEPDLPAGWQISAIYAESERSVAAIYSDSEGYLAAEIWIAQPRSRPVNITTWIFEIAEEARTIDGQPAFLEFSNPGSAAYIFSETTGVQYFAYLHPNEDDPDGRGIDDAIAIARSLYRDEPPPAASERLRLAYNRFDATSWPSTPGSYELRAAGSVITTYEELRDAPRQHLFIHQSDAHRRSQAEVFAGVAAGDLFEWRQADDCWVRYQVTRPPGDLHGAALHKSLAVEPMTYAFTGCSGEIDADSPVTFDFGPLPDLGGTSLTAPVVHGVYQIVPVGWTGATKALEPSEPSSPLPPVVRTRDIAEARRMHHWREIAVPAGWTFDKAQGGGYEISPVDGYCAWYVTASGEPGLKVCGEKGIRIWYGAREAAWHNGTSVAETRVVSGRPASVIYSKADPYFPLKLRVYDAATQVEYTIHGQDRSLRGGNVDAVIAIAESLFAPPNEPNPDPAPSTPPVTPPSPTFDTPPGVYADITVGEDHACALTEAGEAVCWGIESDTLWDTPPGPYTATTAERDTTCAITDGGEIVCWREQGLPIPEYGEDPSRDAPPGRYTAIAFIGGYYCALTDSAEAVCWGAENYDVRPPDPPPGRYTSIGVGSFHPGLGWVSNTVCATADTGDVVCWEGNRHGKSTGHYPDDYIVVDVPGHGFCALTVDGEISGPSAVSRLDGCGLSIADDSDPYVAMGVGQNHTCAVTEAGEAECGTHGTGSVFSGALTVMNPPDPPPGRRYTAISVGGAYACALTDAGAAVCWKEVENKVEPPDPPPGRYVAVSDGVGHTCALTDDGEAVCWGRNNFGQVDVPPGRYTAISAGVFGTCGITDVGEAVCWGGYHPVEPPAGRYVAISSGANEACALTAAGEAVCWGSSSGDPGWALADGPPGPFVSISLSWIGHACALTEAGEAVCWGRNANGQADVPPGRYRAISAGHYDYTCALTESEEVVCWGSTHRPLQESPPGRFVALSTGRSHACALTSAGNAACWGTFAGGWDKQGYGPVTPPAGRYTAISSTMSRACALTENGRVVCWGDTEYEGAPYADPYSYNDFLYPPDE